MSADPYSVLGVPRDATIEVMQIAYRAAALKYHPDRQHSYVQRIWATKKMQEINEAYSVLRSRFRDDLAVASTTFARDNQQEAVGASRPISDRWTMPWENVVFNVAWGAASLLVFVSLAVHRPPKSFFLWICLAGLSVFAALPVVMIVMTVIMFMVFGFMTIAEPFQESFSASKLDNGRSRLSIARDLAVRLGLLVLLLCGLYISINVNGSSLFVFYLLLSWMGGLMGELAAMVAWFFLSPSVSKRTSELLNRDVGHK